MRTLQNRKRLLAIILAGMALFVGAFGYRYFQGRPIGHGPAGPPVSRQNFSRIWSDKDVLLVGLGDSVTAGFGARRGYSYFDRLVANPVDEFEEMRGISLKAVFPKMQFINLAISGSTSLEHVERQFPKLHANSNVVALVVITTGGNDLIHNYGRTPPRDQAMYGATWEQAKPWIAEFQQRLESMVSAIEQRFPGKCHIFLANIYDPTDGIGDMEHANLPSWPDGLKILAAYNAAIRTCAEKHPNVHLVNFHDAFLGHGIHCTQFWRGHYDSKDPHYWYYDNLEDPNERGYDVIRKLFLNEIATISDRLAGSSP